MQIEEKKVIVNKHDECVERFTLKLGKSRIRLEALEAEEWVETLVNFSPQ